MSRTKGYVYAGNLHEARFARPNTTRDDGRENPFTLYLTMGTTSGMVPVRGRKTLVLLAYAEVADVIGAIPASLMDEDDLRAAMRLTDLMRRLADATGE